MSATVPINNVLVGGFSGACTSVTSPPSAACDDGEQVLDIVNAIGMAPGIQQILFYEGSSNTEILNQDGHRQRRQGAQLLVGLESGGCR